MNEKEKAEAYVRSKLPELMELSFGCAFRHKQDHDDRHFIFHCSESHPFLFVAKTDGTSGHYLDFDKREYEIIGHPIQLQHWLRVLKENSGNPFKLDMYGNLIALNMLMNEIVVMKFDLQTGQPATEADYQSFNQIVGI